ncbi:MAG: hypothetical protein IJ971_01355, partial [Bacteroidales bacterium]|nr:hypothetical protein [Bacteroidales bacterium]
DGTVGNANANQITYISAACAQRLTKTPTGNAFKDYLYLCPQLIEKTYEEDKESISGTGGARI